MTSQLALYEDARPAPRRPARRRPAIATSTAPLCAACRAREARYGFRAADDDPQAGARAVRTVRGGVEIDRPRTLCFECFRAELDRRRTAQAALPLEKRIESLARRRRRAQIAARHALDLR
jgi:hypothetical protein